MMQKISNFCLEVIHVYIKSKELFYDICIWLVVLRSKFLWSIPHNVPISTIKFKSPWSLEQELEVAYMIKLLNGPWFSFCYLLFSVKIPREHWEVVIHIDLQWFLILHVPLYDKKWDMKPTSAHGYTGQSIANWVSKVLLSWLDRQYLQV